MRGPAYIRGVVGPSGETVLGGLQPRAVREQAPELLDTVSPKQPLRHARRRREVEQLGARREQPCGDDVMLDSWLSLATGIVEVLLFSLAFQACKRGGTSCVAICNSLLGGLLLCEKFHCYMPREV